MKLCINADDFGMSEDINAGILDCMDYGVVSSCSAMVTESAASQVHLLKNDESVSVGLHFTLTGTQTPLFLNKMSPLQLMFQDVLGKFSEEELSTEASRQFSLLHSQLGRSLSHIDSHQHIHLLPKVRRVMRHLARNNGISYVRSPRENSPDISLKQLCLRLAFAFDNPKVDFFGINLMGKKFTQENIVRHIEYLKKCGTEEALWMVHVGYETKSGLGSDTYNAERQHELKVLKDLRPYLRDQVHIVSLEALL